MTNSNVFSSIFSDLTSYFPHPFADHRIQALLVPFSISFSSLSFVPSIWSIALPWPLVRMLTKTLLIQRWPCALERWTVP